MQAQPELNACSESTECLHLQIHSSCVNVVQGYYDDPANRARLIVLNSLVYESEISVAMQYMY